MKKNILIAFSGMDGSGKTTLAKKLSSHLQKKDFAVFFKHAHGYAISQNSLAISEQALRKKRLLFVLLSPYVLLDSWFTYLFNYRKILRQQSLVCDRYFYDKIVRLIYYQICPLSLAKIYLYFLPKPDVYFFLDVDVNTAFLRKPEYSKKELARFRRLYLLVAKYLNATIIPTNTNIKATLELMTKKFELQFNI